MWVVGVAAPCLSPAAGTHTASDWMCIPTPEVTIHELKSCDSLRTRLVTWKLPLTPLLKCHSSAFRYFSGHNVSRLEGTWNAPAGGTQGAVLWVMGKGEGCGRWAQTCGVSSVCLQGVHGCPSPCSGSGHTGLFYSRWSFPSLFRLSKANHVLQQLPSTHGTGISSEVSG